MPPSSSFRHSRGFTLVEMMIACAIFILLIGGVYFAVSSSITSTTQLAQVQVDARKISALDGFLREGFRNLSTDTVVTLRSHRMKGGKSAIDLILDRAPDAFTLQAVGGKGGSAVLSFQPAPDGTWALMLARLPDDLTTSELDRSLTQVAWLPVLENLASLRWRFWDDNLHRYVEFWDQAARHPRQIELTYVLAGEPATTSIFSLPPLSSTGLPQRTPPQS